MLYLVNTTLSFVLLNQTEMNNESLNNLILNIFQLRKIRQILPKSPEQGTAFPNNPVKSLYYACFFCSFPFSRIILGVTGSPMSPNPQPEAFSFCHPLHRCTSLIQQRITETFSHRNQNHFQELYMYISSWWKIQTNDEVLLTERFLVDQINNYVH